ncbi:hypothetical protein GCM10009589_06590 [Arthrobacter pascens]
MQLVTEIVGWAGAAIMLTAYLSVSMGWFQVGRRFQAANMLASGALVITAPPQVAARPDTDRP